MIKHDHISVALNQIGAQLMLMHLILGVGSVVVCAHATYMEGDEGSANSRVKRNGVIDEHQSCGRVKTCAMSVTSTL